MLKFFLTGVLTLVTLTVYATDQISMFIGEIKILEVGSIDRVAVGKGDLLSTSILENGQLLILAEKKGETTVHIWYTDGAESDLKIEILEADTGRIVTELQTLLSNLEGVQVKVVGQKIFLTGTLNCIAGLETCAEDEIVKTVLTAYGDVMNLTRPAYIQPPSILPSTKMVNMDVKITELNKDKTTKLGIDWDEAITGPSAALAHIWVGSDFLIPLLFTGENSPNPVTLTDPVTGATQTFASASGTVGIGTDISSVINLLVQTGDAIVLAEPRLSARSGGHAEFLAGGEIPVVTTSLSGTNVEYKEFGIVLNIAPVVDDDNHILATVTTEISAIDAATPIGESATPAFISRKTSTEVSMNDGETLILSGLISRDVSEGVKKFPILGDIPILGALFRSTDWRNALTELVIFVTPTVFDAKSEFNIRRVQRGREMLDEFKERIQRDDLILE